MPTLRTSLGSPFGRKACIATIHLGLEDRVTIVPAQTSDVNDPIHAFNPLRKIPVLVRDDHVAIYDSPVILEYLDWLAGGGRVIPTEPDARFNVLTLQALADGMTEAMVLIRYEDRWRSQTQRAEHWLAHQQRKIDGALAALEQTPPPSQGVDVGQIALACGLGFYKRLGPETWRHSHPRLSAWLDAFANRVPAFARTQT
jgi:glutathione S-transferase